MRDLAREACALATRAHAGQVDKLGRPYIEHPERVARRVRLQGAAVEAAAWLHDVVEDTAVTLSDLRDLYGFPEVVVRAVDALTHLPHEPRADYYERIRADPIALVVKIADVDDNSDPARLAMIEDDATRARLHEKYGQARRALRTP